MEVDYLFTRLRREGPEQLFWLPREPSDFASECSRMRERMCKMWNAQYAGLEAFTVIGKRGYHVGTINYKPHYKHRVLWAMHYGEWPSGCIDHINGVKTDNRIENLRDVSHAENMRNLSMSKANKTGVTGVWFDAARNKYQAYITHNKKRVRLGRFDTLEEAAEARREIQSTLLFSQRHGEDVSLDQPPG